MLGVTEAQRKHKDTQKAGHCMATTDHKVRRGWRAQPVAAASPVLRVLKDSLRDALCCSGRFPP